MGELPENFGRLTERQQLALIQKLSAEEGGSQARTPAGGKSKGKAPGSAPQTDQGPPKRRKPGQDEHALYGEFGGDGLWEPQEHDLFVATINQETSFEQQDWEAIASSLSGRTTEQCTAYFTLLHEQGVVSLPGGMPAVSPPPSARRVSQEDDVGEAAATPRQEAAPEAPKKRGPGRPAKKRPKAAEEEKPAKKPAKKSSDSDAQAQATTPRKKSKASAPKLAPGVAAAAQEMERCARVKAGFKTAKELDAHAARLTGVLESLSEHRVAWREQVPFQRPVYNAI